MAAHPLRSASSTAARFALDRLEHVREGARVSHLQPRILCLGGVGRSMTKQDVRQLVRHHADDLGFRRRRVEHAAVHEHRPAGQRKGIDLFEVHRRERILVDRLLEFWRRRATSCSGLYLFLGSLIAVCASPLSDDAHRISVRNTTRTEGVVVAILGLLRVSGRHVTRRAASDECGGDPETERGEQ
jgi:hypothetical protein